MYRQDGSDYKMLVQFKIAQYVQAKDLPMLDSDARYFEYA
jgi:hypothetical protein